MSSLGPEIDSALRERMQYYRDLGVYSFYRRCEPDPQLFEAAELTPSQTEPNISPRKSSVAPPEIPVAQLVIPPEQKAAALEAIRAELVDCNRCPLATQGRHTIVFGDGDPNAR
ncbi:MAG TPA: hypothetical protein VFL96_06380, partial [Acidobacteriaceae bacterium]|nr:hypothetical protein [Acidobacteriaceae bacterium]